MVRSLIVALSLSLFCFAGCDFVPQLQKSQSNQTEETKTETEDGSAAPEATPTEAEAEQGEKETSRLWTPGQAQAVAYALGDDRLAVLGEEPATPPVALRVNDDGVEIPGVLKVDDDGVTIPGVLRVGDEGVEIYGVLKVGEGKRNEAPQRATPPTERRVF